MKTRLVFIGLTFVRIVDFITKPRTLHEQVSLLRCIRASIISRGCQKDQAAS